MKNRRKPVNNEESQDLWSDGKAPIIVPLSDSPEAKAAIPVAKTVAKITGGVLHLLHITDVALSPDKLLRKLDLRREEVREMVLDQSAGLPAPTIARAAGEWRARLIAMATFGRRKPLSPVAEGVLKLAPCPVIFVRPESPRLGEELRSILLPLDGTPTTSAAIGPAMELAARSKARLEVVYVVEPGAPSPEEPGTLTVPRYIDQPQHEWPAWAREFLERFCCCVGEDCPVGPTRLFLRRGDPAKEILHFAAENENDLIVLVWRGQFRGKRAATIKAVLRDAPCPVLVLRTHG